MRAGEAAVARLDWLTALARQGQRPFRYREGVYRLLGMLPPDVPTLVPSRAPGLPPLIYRDHRDHGASGWTTERPEPARPARPIAELPPPGQAEVSEPMRPPPPPQPVAAPAPGATTASPGMIPLGHPAAPPSGATVAEQTVAARPAAASLDPTQPLLQSARGPERTSTRATTRTDGPEARLAPRDASPVPAWPRHPAGETPLVRAEIPLAARSETPTMVVAPPRPEPGPPRVTGEADQPPSPSPLRHREPAPPIVQAPATQAPTAARTPPGPGVPSGPAHGLGRGHAFHLRESPPSPHGWPPPLRARSNETSPRSLRASPSAPLASRATAMPTFKMQEKLAELTRELASLRQRASNAAPPPSPPAIKSEAGPFPARPQVRRLPPPPAGAVWARHHLGHFHFRLAR